MAASGIEHAKQLALMTMDRQVIGETIRRELLQVRSKLFDSEPEGAGGGAALFPLLADLMRGELKVDVPKLDDLAGQFGKSPEDVLNLYELDRSARQALASRDHQKIAEHV